MRAKIREKVREPEIAESSCPRDYPIGTKRLCVDTDYFETFNRAKCRSSISAQPRSKRSRPRACARRPAKYEVDVIVFATGFDAMTGALLRIDIRGRGGRSLKDKWAGGPRTYLGLMSRRIPNLFTMTGPGSPSVLTNMMVSIEQHVDWIADCLADLRETRHRHDRSDQPAEDAWVSTSPRSPSRRSIQKPIPGTWAPTSRANHASFSPMLAASPLIAKNANSSPTTDTRVLPSPRPEQIARLT